MVIGGNSNLECKHIKNFRLSHLLKFNFKFIFKRCFPQWSQMKTEMSYMQKHRKIKLQFLIWGKCEEGTI